MLSPTINDPISHVLQWLRSHSVILLYLLHPIQASNSTHQVTQFHYHSWGAHKAPTSAAGLITLIDEVQRVQRSTANKPIVVHCR